MMRLAPISRREFVRRLKQLGFEGPYAGGNHELMLRVASGRRLTLPNPHRNLISVDLLARVLRQAGVTREEWETSGG
jgi:predicted RNA binding protein YcfA (HicA-like mRNA interferase family)